jgi:MFS family permease
MSSNDARRAARYALIVLTFINLFNYLDRWVVAAVLESIRKSELGLNDTQLGFIGSGFIIVYMMTSPLFGSLGDRQKRPPLIALGVAIWSIATALGGFARGFVSLFTARSCVGIGEAAYGTIAPALLSDHFKLEERGRVFAIFFAALPVGSAAGYVLGGLVDKAWGWRAAFWIAGFPGLLLSLLILLVKEVPRGAQDVLPATHDPRSATRSRYADLFRNTEYILSVLGYAGWTFAVGGLAYWFPAFLERIRGMSHQQATVTFGLIALVTGFFGTFAGGWIGDALLRKTKQSYLWVSGIATLVAAPAAFIAVSSPNRTVYLVAIVIAEVLIFMSTGPINSAIVNVVAPTERATAVGLSIFVMHLLGDVPSPPLIGIVSDHSSLERAFVLVPIAIVVSGAIWTYAAWRGERV